MLLELETLKKMVEQGNYDEASHDLIRDYEKRYVEIVRKKALVNKEGFRQWLDWMNMEIFLADTQLKEKEDLSESVRKDMFATKRVCRKFIDLLTGDEEGLKNEILQDIEINRQ